MCLGGIMAVTVGCTSLGEVNLVMAQGADNTFAFIYYTDTTKTATVDLTGFTARAQIRSKIGGEVYLALTPHITLGTVNGRIDIVVPAVITEALILTSPYSGWWDLELVDTGGGVVRFVEGKVTIDPDVTRPVVP
jgi:hypothetical protein